uniref:KTI-D protein n=1 Tax=Solanum tuberosum TaxID=4113 RepID=A0A097H1A8_SOLTU|nr:Kunitz-type inhibitor D [Solanum tuberosum]
MKSVVLLISFLLAFWCSCTSATTTPNPLLRVVRDIHDDILTPDSRYFVVSVINGAGGGGVFRGIGAGHDANFVCPYQVVQSGRDLYNGMPVIFKPKAAKQVEITESSDVNIEFYIDNPSGICNNTVWEVEGFPGQDLPMYLTTFGEAGNVKNVASWFQIKKESHWYKLMFCPYGEPTCTDIGIDYNAVRRLAIGTGNTFNLVFIKDNTNIGNKSIV